MFHGTSISNRNGETDILTNKLVNLTLSGPELNKIFMYWSDYVKPKYDEKAKLCALWIQTVSLYIKKQMIFTKALQKISETRIEN